MKVRRHTDSGGTWSKLTRWLNPRVWMERVSAHRTSRPKPAKVWIRRGGDATDSDEQPSLESAESQDAVRESVAQTPETEHHPQPNEDTVIPGSVPLKTATRSSRIRRTVSGGQKRRMQPLSEGWLFGGAFAGSLLLGYLVAAVFFFPAPFFSSDETVPRVIDLPLEEAQRAIEAANLVAGEPRRENHPSYPAGHIAWQDPPEGVKAPAGTIVRLAISRGPQEIPVPDVSRYDSDLATTLITRSGLTVRRLDSIQTALPRGVAVGSRPGAGTTLAPGSGVILIVSRGAPTISVPDLAGLTLEEAREELAILGLTMGRTWQEFSNAQAEGLIFRQEPLAGTLIAPGTPIDVVVARTP